jgi:hypothetical protein
MAKTFFILVSTVSVALSGVLAVESIRRGVLRGEHSSLHDGGDLPLHWLQQVTRGGGIRGALDSTRIQSTSFGVTAYDRRESSAILWSAARSRGSSPLVSLQALHVKLQR